ncbi:ABC transporter permease [Octadecabacter sp. G9-8]|uniref:ABC transporter permease n=1 Tax=Octadecabacter dasysiphoniae TaxID=2909341 RepID=A0ABS9CT43_9RHOB|nr:ABC transporter permease [Octadecabacter dasysiphoniae]MCF2870413.1 ABC transporter permease [Octadecabacter dasysiphoniae]
MGSYIFRRILATIPVVLFVMLFVFSLLYITPGDPAAILAGDQATQAEIEAIRIDLGLDRSFPVRFVEWSSGVLRGDFGVSIFTRLPVSTMIQQRVEPTLSLMVVTMVIAITIAVPLGVLAAWKHGSLIDRAIMLFAVLGFSVPVFVIGYVLAWTFALQLGWLPVQGYTPFSEGPWPWLRSLLLPSFTLATFYIAIIARITRATMLEILQQDYIRTARGKGASEQAVLFVHALRNASVPIVTVIGIGITLVISGAVVIESVFALPGLGRLIVDSILRRDYPVIQAVILIFSFVYVIINLLIDLSYTVIDPRIRY